MGAPKRRDAFAHGDKHLNRCTDRPFSAAVMVAALTGLAGTPLSAAGEGTWSPAA